MTEGDENWSDSTPSIGGQFKKATNLPKFDFQETQDLGKKIFTIFGEKGVGKTTLALSFPGKISVLTFDNKTQHVKTNIYNNNPRIKIYDAIKYLVNEVNDYVKSNVETYEYVKFLLQNIKEKDKPDWIVLDGMEIIEKVAEMVMRYNSNLKAFQGVANQNIWKERKLFVHEVHRLALSACKHGVIYTTYTEEDKLVIDGSVTLLEKKPKWVGVIMTETDVVLQVLQSYKQMSGQQIMLKVVSSKFDKLFKTGETINLKDNFNLVSDRLANIGIKISEE